MTVLRKIVDLRIGEPSNAGLSLKAAFAGIYITDRRIDSLLAALFAIPYSLP